MCHPLVDEPRASEHPDDLVHRTPLGESRWESAGTVAVSVIKGLCVPLRPPAVEPVEELVLRANEVARGVADVREFVTELAEARTDREVHVDVNTADDYDEGSVYLTVTGTSAEQGDDGSVGRGNRANGLITPNRPMSMEATSGKNPVNHIGKIYNLLSTRIAESVTDEVDGIRDLQVRLLSQIGRPIDEPHVADAQLVTEEGLDIADIEDEVVAIVDEELANVTDVTRSVIDGDVSTF